MRIILISLFMMFSMVSKASDSSVVKLRNLYYASAVSSKSANVFFETVRNWNDDRNALVKCYKGTAYMLQARYLFSPYSKLYFFNKGKNLLEQAIQSSPYDVEVRFVRFSIQTNVPFFLGYSYGIETDKQVIINSWKNISDPDLKKRIRNYMLNTEYCSETEKAVFK